MKLIDKDALVAEIEKRTDELWALIPDGEKVISDKHTKEDAFNLGKYTALESLDKFIDTLEVKDVDLEKEITEYINKHFHIRYDETLEKGSDPLNTYDFEDIAKHFFELGLKVHKGK